MAHLGAHTKQELIIEESNTLKSRVKKFLKQDGMSGTKCKCL